MNCYRKSMETKNRLQPQPQTDYTNNEIIKNNEQYSTTSIHPKKGDKVINPGNKKDMKKNIIKFNIRKRINKYGIVYLDRYIPNDINDIQFNEKNYVQEYNKLDNHNIILKEKMLQFQKVWNISDNEEEESVDTIKDIKKTLSGFKNFIKNKKNAA